MPTTGGEQSRPPIPFLRAQTSNPVEPVDDSRNRAVAGRTHLAERLTQSRTPEGRLAALIAGNGSGARLDARARDGPAPASRTARRCWSISGRRRTGSPTSSNARRRMRCRFLGSPICSRARASFGEVIRRDLSSGLDVIPSGGDADRRETRGCVRRTESAYGCVVFHASDWRSAPARVAADSADAIVLVAPAAVAARCRGGAGSAWRRHDPALRGRARRSPRWKRSADDAAHPDAQARRRRHQAFGERLIRDLRRPLEAEPRGPRPDRAGLSRERVEQDLRPLAAFVLVSRLADAEVECLESARSPSARPPAAAVRPGRNGRCRDRASWAKMRPLSRSRLGSAPKTATTRSPSMSACSSIGARPPRQPSRETGRKACAAALS